MYRRWVEGALIGLAGGALVTTVPPGLVERAFSRGVYPRLQPGLTWISDLTPVAWLDLLAGGAVVWLVWRVWRSVRAPRGRRLREAGVTLWRTAVAVAAGYLAFLALWGLNYQRVPLEAAIGFDAGRVTPERVNALAAHAVERANATRAGAGDRATREDEAAATVRALPPAFQQTLADLGFPPARPARPKTPVLTFYFNATGVSGMTNPFGLETLVAGNLLPFERPLVVAHEWAHLAGRGSESEAGFIGILTCLRSDELAQYSAWLDLALRSVRGLDPAARRDVLSRLSAAVRSDVQAMAARSERDEIDLARLVAWRVYDSYLTTHGVPGGIANYDAVITLLLGSRDAPL